MGGPVTFGELINTALPAIQFATLILVGVYVWKTSEMAAATRRSVEVAGESLQEIKETRDQEVAPYVVAYFDVPYDEHMIYLVVKNIGKGIARDVGIKFDPPLQSSNFGDLLDQFSLLKDGIGSLAPGQEIRTDFDTTHGYLGNEHLPRRYQAEISYFGGLLPSLRTTEVTLDLGAYWGRISHDRANLARQMRRIADEQRKTRDALEEIRRVLDKGIWIRNPDFVINDASPVDDDQTRTILAKLREFDLMWTSLCGVEKDSAVDVSTAQIRATLLSEQLAVMLSHSSKGLSPEVRNAVTEIAYRLFELGRIRLYLDGGISHAKFIELGHSIVGSIGQAVRLMDPGDPIAGTRDSDQEACRDGGA